MGKGRPNNERQNLIYIALKNAYEKLREKDKNSFPSWKEISEEANKNKLIINSPIGKIGDKTLEQSKNSQILDLRQRIKDDKELFGKIADQIPSQLSIRNEELKSSLEANVLLAAELEQMEKTVENKNNIIDEFHRRIVDYEQEIGRLRNQIREMAKNLGNSSANAY
jgi:uncharacterized coiled-coil protein SlyX